MGVKNRQGQAALEYLVTYGWGFIILLVVIGALAYLGFLSPSRYIPARCEFGNQMECVDYKFEAMPAGNNPANHGTVIVKIRNNFGDDIIIDRIRTPNVNSAEFATKPLVRKGNVSDPIYFSITTTDQIQLVKGDRVSVPLIITFHRNKVGSPTHNVTGEIFATVQ